MNLYIVLTSGFLCMRMKMKMSRHETHSDLVGRRGGGWLTMYSRSSKMAMGLWPVAGVRGVRGVRGLGTGCTMFAGSSENAGPKIWRGFIIYSLLPVKYIKCCA